MTFWNNPSNLQLKQQHRWVVSFDDHDYSPTKNSTDNIIPTYYAKSVDQPSYTIKTVQAKYLFAHTFNFPTRVVWNPISITFYDVVINRNDTQYVFSPKKNNINFDLTPKQSDINQKYYKRSTQLFFYRLLQDSGYFNPEEFDKEDQLLRFRAYNFKKNMIKSLVGASPDFSGSNSVNVNTAEWKKLKISQISANAIASNQILSTWELYNPLVSDVKFDKLDYSSEAPVTITAKIEYDWAKLVIPDSDKADKIGTVVLNTEPADAKTTREQRLIKERLDSLVSNYTGNLENFLYNDTYKPGMKEKFDQAFTEDLSILQEKLRNENPVNIDSTKFTKIIAAEVDKAKDVAERFSEQIDIYLTED